jgi:hypothetical protein
VGGYHIKEVIACVLSRTGAHGGIKFDYPDEAFEKQLAVQYLPKSITTPVEVIISICTSHMGDFCKDIAIEMFAEMCCERLEHFVSQVRMII